MNANTVKLIFQRNLPEIMEGVGIAFGILATIKACEATLHVEEELDRIQRHTEAIKEVPEEEGINTKKELTKAYIKGAGRIARLYAPAVALGAASIGSVLYGHHIIKKENKTTIMITHDIAEAISMADRVVVLSSRPSTVKVIYDIKLTDKSSPINNRTCKEFNSYYQTIWRSIEHEIS